MAEHAVELEVPYFDPEPNVPEPALLHSERKCFLVYWDRGSNRRALEFFRCSISKFGYPNDEALGGHRLFGKGLSFYSCFEVIESEWIVELRKGNEVNFPNFSSFADKRHFIITFHDSTFECIASGFGAASFPPEDLGTIRLDELF